MKHHKRKLLVAVGLTGLVLSGCAAPIQVESSSLTSHSTSTPFATTTKSSSAHDSVDNIRSDKPNPSMTSKEQKAKEAKEKAIAQKKKEERAHKVAVQESHRKKAIRDAKIKKQQEIDRQNARIAADARAKAARVAPKPVVAHPEAPKPVAPTPAAPKPVTTPAPEVPVATTPTAVPTKAPEASTAAPKDGLNWSALAQCESGGNPQAWNAAGYGGLYQFDQQTWASVGGQGSIVGASAAEQTKRAQMLYAQRGASPWPTCGKML